MKIFWKILSEIYCTLVLIGIEFEPPWFLFHQPKYKFLCQYVEKVWADKNFTSEERIHIINGIRDFEKFCNGLVRFTIDFSLDPTAEIAADKSLLLKVNKDHPAIVASDERIKSTTLGLCQYLQSGAKIVYLVNERLDDPITYRTTVTHEFGHYVGLEHTKRDSIMHKANFGHVLYPTYIDAQEFATKYNCDPEDLKYFRL